VTRGASTEATELTLTGKITRHLEGQDMRFRNTTADLLLSQALASLLDYERQHRETLRGVCAIVRASGGEVRVPYRLLVENGELDRTDDVDKGEYVFRARYLP
jgi:hypothetical protein